MTHTAYLEALALAREHSKHLNKVYKSTIGLVNDLKNRSRNYMEQVADVEDGLSMSENAHKASIAENIMKLAKDIDTFNLEIGKKGERFTEEFDLVINHIDQALMHYEGAEGELTDLLKSRRELMFLEVLLRKFKSKINSLQLMNNALFSFSSELAQVKQAYKSNLINVSTLITNAIEDCNKRIQKIETIN